MIHSAPRAKSRNSAATSRKRGLALQVVPRHAVHFGRAEVDLALGVEVAVHVAAGRPPVDELERRELDDAVALLRVEAGGLGVEDDLAHAGIGDRRSGRGALAMRCATMRMQRTKFARPWDA